MKIKRKLDDDIDVDMSPMIDLVFLLLIFFLVASAVIDEKKPVTIPDAVYAKVPEDETGRLLITVAEDGQMYVHPNSNPLTMDELKEKISDELEFDPEIRVVLRADGRVKYKVNEKIMEACSEVGANDLTFSAFEK